MNSARSCLAAVLLFATTSAMSGVPASAEQERASARDFEATVQQLQWTFGGYGLTTVVAMDYQRILKTSAVETRRAVLLEASRREWIQQLLAQDPALGWVLPIRVYVYEDADGVAHVRVAAHIEALVSHPSDAVRRFGERLNRKLERMVDTAVTTRAAEGSLQPQDSAGSDAPMQ